MESIQDISKQAIEKILSSQKRRGGINDPLTEQRAITAEWLGISFGQITGLTRGWKTQQLFILRKEAESFEKNPKALWWKLYKERNKLYGKSKKDVHARGLHKMGKTRGTESEIKKQESLF